MDVPSRIEAYDIEGNHDQLNPASETLADTIDPGLPDSPDNIPEQEMVNPKNFLPVSWGREPMEIGEHKYKPARHDLSPKRDPCTITSRVIGPISYNMVKACLDADFDFPETLRRDTAETIKNLISSFYVFEDLAANPPTDDDNQGLSFVQAELMTEIDRLQRQSDKSRVIGDEEIDNQVQSNKNLLSDRTLNLATKIQLTHREFHDGLSEILSRARDGHLSYDADCFRAFRFQHGFFMNHIVRDGQTVLKVHSVAPYFGTVNGIQDNILGCDVVKIAGKDPSKYVQDWADRHVSMSKDANIRFNAALVTPQYRPGTADFFIPGKFSERFILPEEMSLNFTFRCPGQSSKNLINVDAKWVGFYTHDITRPYKDTQSFYEANCIKSIAEGISSEKNSSSSTGAAPSESSSGSTKTVNDILSKLEMVSPQQLPVVKFYDDYGGRPGEMNMASNAAIFTEIYRGQHGITALLLKDDKTGIITVRTESSTIRGQPYSRVHPAWAGSLIQAIDALRPLAENLILDLSHNTGGYICLGLTMVQLFFPERPRLVTNVRLSPLGKHMMAAGAMGMDHFIKSYGEPMTAAYQDSNFSHIVSHPHRNLTFTDYLSDRCAIADHYAIKVDPEVESKRNRSSSSAGEGSRTTDDQVYHPWDPKNIAILTDGYCGSSCALISNMMHTKFGVKTVVIGGKSPKAESMGYSTFPGLQVIDDQLIFSEIQDVRLKLMLKDLENERQTGSDVGQTPFFRNQDLTHPHGESKGKSQDNFEVKVDDSDGSGDDDDKDDDENDDQVDNDLEFPYPLDFAHKSRLRLTWRQIYNTGPKSSVFKFNSEHGSYDPIWSEVDQWQEYNFIPATHRIDYTDHNVHSIGAIWGDARDAIWGSSGGL
ncbi:hypothetical protein BGX27_008150 [Mortierella sp. AM989]|nr:hypothetical protein BGX27_008150 [Mortierella sp. AM989]